MELLKRIFELWVKTIWIKTIQKEERKLERLEDAANRQKYVVRKLREAFLEECPPREVQK